MGRIKKGVNGPFRGKAGSVVGSSWRKINYIKSLPHFSKHRIPSVKQAVQHLKFKLLTDFLRPLSELVELGFHQYTGKATGHNIAFRFNYEQAFVETGGTIALNYPALRLSRGTLYPAGAENAWIENHILHVTWDPDTYGMGGTIDDIGYVTAYCASADYFVSNQECTRGDGGVQIDVNGLSLTEGMHVWLFFANRAQTRVSNTIYIPVTLNHF